MTKLSELMLKHWINLIKWLGSSLGNSNGIQTVFIKSFLRDKFEISRVFKDILNPLIKVVNFLLWKLEGPDSIMSPPPSTLCHNP